MLCSFGYAKQLKQLKIKQKSQFYYIYDSDNGDDADYVISFFDDEVHLLNYEKEFAFKSSFADAYDIISAKNKYSAYTLQELFKILPYKIHKDRAYFLTIGKNELGTIMCKYINPSTNFCLILISEKTPEDTFASMVVHLVNKNLISVDDINKAF